MKAYTEVRWHGRGGQGTVTAAKVFAEAALHGGKHVQAFPEYGPERMGAPLRAYNRVSSKPIRIHAQVTNPDIVVIVDPTLIGSVDVAEGTDNGAVFLINSPNPPDAFKAQLGAKRKIYTVDATKISLETIGKPLPNTPLLGALARVEKMLNLERLIAVVKKSFGKKFSDKVINSNIEAVERAYKEVQGA